MNNEDSTIEKFKNIVRSSLLQIIYLNEIQIENDIINQFVEKIYDNIKLELEKT